MRGRCRQATDPERWPRARSPSARGEVRVKPRLLDQRTSTHKPCLGNLIPDIAYSVANTITPKPQPFSLVDAMVFAGKPPRAPGPFRACWAFSKPPFGRPCQPSQAPRASQAFPISSRTSQGLSGLRASSFSLPAKKKKSIRIQRLARL